MQRWSHLRSLVQWATRPHHRLACDKNATAQHLHGTGISDSGVVIEWLGTSGFRISYEGHRLLVDPYVTRISLASFLQRRVFSPSLELIDSCFQEPADAIAVGHTHFDHAADVPALAKRDGCPVFGSSSLAALMALHGLGDRARDVEPYKTYEVGPFELSFVSSKHSRLILGLKVPSDGELTCDHLDGLCPQRYRCGQVFGIHIRVGGIEIYHQGSADFAEDERLPKGVDYFLCGIAGRGFSPEYFPKIAQRLDPRVTIPHHYDDFFAPLSEDMRFSMNVNMAGFFDEVHRTSHDLNVLTLARIGERQP